MQKPQSDTKINEEERIHALLALSSAHPQKRKSCPDTEMLAALVDNTITDAEEKEQLLAHITACSDCYEIWLGTSSQVHAEEEILPEEAMFQEEWFAQADMCPSADVQGQTIEEDSLSQKSPWYSRMVHSIQQQKAPAAAFTVAACLVLFLGSLIVSPPGSPPIIQSTAPEPQSSQKIQIAKKKLLSLEQQQNSSQKEHSTQTRNEAREAAAIEREKRRTLEYRESSQKRKEYSHQLKSPAPSAKAARQNIHSPAPSAKVTRPNIQLEVFQIWVTEIASECRTGKKTTSLGSQQIKKLYAFLIKALEGDSPLDKEIFQSLSHLQKLMSTNKNLIQCNELLPLTDLLDETILNSSYLEQTKE